MTRLVLIRHGESNATVGKFIGGPRTCSGLSELGRQQAAALAERLRRTGEVRSARLIASAYPRAIETAEVLSAAVCGAPVTVDADLGEHDPGPDCDGMTFEAFVDRYGYPNWEDDPYAVTFPGGETLADFHHRVGRGIHRIVASPGDDDSAGATAVVVCHGGVIDTALRQLLRLPMTGAFELRTTNTSVTELVQVRLGRWQLLRYNDACHLEGLPLGTVAE